MNSDKIYDLLGKYFAGEVSKEEKTDVLNWVNVSDENKKEFELHKNSWEASRIRFGAPNSELVFKNVLNKIDDEQEFEISNSSSSAKRHFSLSTIVKIAASITIFLALIYFISDNLEKETEEPNKISLIIKENPSGQKSRIFLPDGSSVTLNAESKISYPEKFSDSIRIVSLVGEAFFDVVKNDNKPFIVNSEDLSTTVLGTSFNVRAFDADPITLVALKVGKVKVEIINNTEYAKAMFLDPGEVITYDKSESRVLKNKFDEEILQCVVGDFFHL